MIRLTRNIEHDLKTNQSFAVIVVDKNESQLNDGARAYINKLEDIVGVPTKIISTGPLRKETLVLDQIISH